MPFVVGPVCLDFGSYRCQKISSAFQGEGSNLESIFTKNVSCGCVAWQARAGTVLTLSIPVVLPQFSFEDYSRVLTTDSFFKNCQYILIITF